MAGQISTIKVVTQRRTELVDIAHKATVHMQPSLEDERPPEAAVRCL